MESVDLAKVSEGSMNEVCDLSRKERRRGAIMDAAFDLFIEQGYSKVGMTDIIRRSGGSLATAYALFENKEGLLRAIVADRFDQYNREMNLILTYAGTPEEVLRQAGRHLYARLLDPSFVGLLRITVAESMRDPDFGRYMKESASETAISVVGKVFEHWHKQGLLALDDSRTAAESFLALLMHRGHMHALCGLPLEMTADEIERHVDHVVEMVLSRYRAGNAPLQ